MATIRKYNPKQKDKIPFIFVISVVLFFMQGVINSKTINKPNLFYLLMLLALIFCCYKERKMFNDINHFAIGHFFIQYFVLFLLFTGGGMTVFGAINTFISKNTTVESDYFEILKVSDNTSVTSNYVEIDMEGEKISVSYKNSKLISDLVHNPSLRDNYFLYLEYKKGILGTYIVLNKDIVER
ncbi:MAG: hypothetical protein LBV47_00105 [Bacteroidales bacterium]|jgi:predicted membrane protein|nr:hypothetical protein [Bacteroidales bacterium]